MLLYNCINSCSPYFNIYIIGNILNMLFEFYTISNHYKEIQGIDIYYLYIHILTINVIQSEVTFVIFFYFYITLIY